MTELAPRTEAPECHGERFSKLLTTDRNSLPKPGAAARLGQDLLESLCVAMSSDPLERKSQGPVLQNRYALRDTNGLLSNEGLRSSQEIGADSPL